MRIGITVMDPPLPFVEEPKHYEASINETPIMESEMAIGDNDTVNKEKGKRSIIKQEIRQIPRPPQPFPSRLIRKVRKKNLSNS